MTQHADTPYREHEAQPPDDLVVTRVGGEWFAQGTCRQCGVLVQRRYGIVVLIAGQGAGALPREYSEWMACECGYTHRLIGDLPADGDGCGAFWKIELREAP